jgi:hypothetical protein
VIEWVEILLRCMILFMALLNRLRRSSTSVADGAQPTWVMVDFANGSDPVAAKQARTVGFKQAVAV